jgi:hypothetical protein
VDWREKAKAVGRFTAQNLDALFIILVAGGVLALEITASPDRDLIDSTLLALLGVTALVLLRDRQGRARVDEIAAFVQDLQSDRPYEVQSEYNRWEIESGGSQATFTKSQRLLFTRNEVCTLEHWCTGSVGTVEHCQAEWRFSQDEPWLGASTIHDFGINNGRNYIFSLDTERSRGDALQWKVTRVLKDRFPNPRESVSLKLQAPTHRPRMHVVWPTDKEPQQIEIRHDEGPGRKLKPQRGKDGRLFVDEQLAAGSANSVAKIEWTW